MWTALIAILILRYLQLKSKFSWSLSNLVALLRMNLFTYCVNKVLHRFLLILFLTRGWEPERDGRVRCGAWLSLAPFARTLIAYMRRGESCQWRNSQFQPPKPVARGKLNLTDTRIADFHSTCNY